MNHWFKKAREATQRLINFPIIPERQEYPAHHELWQQPRGVGPRPHDDWKADNGWYLRPGWTCLADDWRG